MVTPLRVTPPSLSSPPRLRLLGSVSGRLTAGLIGLLFLTVAVSVGAIYQMHRMTASLDRLVNDNVEPLLDAQDLVQRVQILVALTPKLLNARNAFEIDNLQLQITDMFDMLDQGLAAIAVPGRLKLSGASIAKQRDALRAAIDQLSSLVKRQMQLRDDLIRARRLLDKLLGPGTMAGAAAEAGSAHGIALAAMLYQASLANDLAEVDRGHRQVVALLGRSAAGSTARIASLVDGPSSLFSIRRQQIELEQKLQGEAGNTNLRANQLVYAVTGLGAELRRLTNQAREEGRQSVHRATIRATIVVTVAALIDLTLVAYLHINVLRRLVALRNGVVGSAAGSPLPVTDDGQDEIGDLARSLRYFIEQIGIKEEELRRLAATDALTGLANRREFTQRGEAELLRARRYGNALCVIMMDIDHFKQVNDTWGHGVGDGVIRKVADISREVFRAVDVIGRIGGEEFAVLLAHTAMEGAVIVAERLRETVASTQVAIGDNQKINISISIGITEMLHDDVALGQLLGRADEALYTAKHLGRNRVCCAQSRGQPTKTLV